MSQVYNVVPEENLAQNLLPAFNDAADAVPALEQPPVEDGEDYVGTIEVPLGMGGARVFGLYSDQGAEMLEFRGWRLDGTGWNMQFLMTENVRNILRAAHDHIFRQQSEGCYLKVDDFWYEVDDGRVYQATINERMDTGDMTWEAMRDLRIFNIDILFKFC